MRYGRGRAAADAEVAYYHCFLRVVEKRFALGDLEKERFVKFMRAYEEFCGVRIVTFCVMSNHFHLLVEVPHRPATLPSDGSKR
ncbi:MAG: transposase [Verrucomicrobiota bacterium]